MSERVTIRDGQRIRNASITSEKVGITESGGISRKSR